MTGPGQSTSHPIFEILGEFSIGRYGYDAHFLKSGNLVAKSKKGNWLLSNLMPQKFYKHLHSRMQGLGVRGVTSDPSPPRRVATWPSS